MSVNNLGNKTKSGFIWSAFESFSGQGFQFVFSIILARLLAPEVFGIIGMLAIFMALSNSLIDSGFGNALMQKNDRNQTDYSTVFYVNLFMSICIYAVMFFAAPYIADFYNMPVLEGVTRVLSLQIIISGLILVQITKLTIDLNFKKLTKIRVLSTVLSGIIGVLMAYKGFGVWSLVGQSLSNYFFQMILIWSFSHWLPSLCFSRDSFNKLFRFGSKLLIAGLIGQVFENINSLIIGKFYKPQFLGYYTKARSLVQLPSATTTTVIYRVSFPVLCNIQEDDERLSLAIHKLIRLTYFIVFPLMLGLLVVADPLVEVLLTSKWSACVPYMQILCVSMSLYPICAYNIDVLLVKGHSGLHLKIDIAKKVFTVLVLFVTASISVTAICLGGILTGLFSWLLEGYYGSKKLNFKIKDQIKDILPSLFLSLLMAAMIYPISLFSFPAIIILVAQILIGAIAYTLLSYSFERKLLVEFVQIFRNNRK